MTATEDDRARPWNIKNVPETVRNRATAAAAKIEAQIGEYVTQALIEKISRDRSTGKQKPEVFDPHQNMDALEKLVTLAMQVSELNKGEPPPAHLTRAIYVLINRRVKAIGEVGHTRLLTGPGAEPADGSG